MGYYRCARCGRRRRMESRRVYKVGRVCRDCLAPDEQKMAEHSWLLGYQDDPEAECHIAFAMAYHHAFRAAHTCEHERARQKAWDAWQEHQRRHGLTWEDGNALTNIAHERGRRNPSDSRTGIVADKERSEKT